jgi:hypothetical protein
LAARQDLSTPSSSSAYTLTSQLNHSDALNIYTASGRHLLGLLLVARQPYLFLAVVTHQPTKLAVNAVEFFESFNPLHRFSFFYLR